MRPTQHEPLREIDVAGIMREIRRAVALKKIANPSPSHNDAESSRQAATASKGLDSTSLPPHKPAIGQSSHAVEELLAFHDQEFIKHAYLATLNREADADGYTHYLQSIRSGTLSKIEVLGRLRYAAEGRREGVKISGLMRRFAFKLLTKLPLVGYFIEWLALLFRLPSIIRRTERSEASLYAELTTIRDQINAKMLAQEQTIRKLAEILQQISGAKEAEPIDQNDQRKDP